MTGLESNLVLTAPIVLIGVGVWAWTALERWIREAVERGSDDCHSF